MRSPKFPSPYHDLIAGMTEICHTRSGQFVSFISFPALRTGHDIRTPEIGSVDWFNKSYKRTVGR